MSEKQLYNFIEIDENGFGRNILFSAESAPQTGTFVKVLDDPMQYLSKQFVNGVWIDVPQSEQVEPEPTQLDRIEMAINKSNEELRQEGAEALTLELIEGGIL